jgi:predicted MFS family arabinose efflux permease
MSAMLLASYGYGPAIAGLIGIPGAAGILIARYAGRWMDKSGIGPVVTAGVSTIIVSQLVFGLAPISIAFIVIGVALLDCGLRAALVANQTAVTHAAPDARSRATTIFTSHMWGGNAAGAALASVAYAHWGWYAVCAIGAIAASTALIIARATNRP